MNRSRRIAAALAVALTGLAACTAWAIDDRFDAAKTEKGGFAPIANATYAKECGSCHFTYLPGMLPERSWKALLASKDHFGESLDLAPGTKRELEEYLAANAGDHSDYRGSELMLERLDLSRTPMRITTLPLFNHRHVVIRKMMAESNLPVKRLTNCDACHENASSGSFAYDHIVVPGVTKVIKPGSLF
jgi:cytochrome c553